VTAYGGDLAWIHDAGFGDFARNAAPRLLRALRQSGIREGLVADLGCGSGIWAQILVRAGYEVLGVDLSPAMIRLARRRAPGARFRVASLWSAALPACDAVTALGECFNYCFDPRSRSAHLGRLFRRIHHALRPGGVLIFDIAGPGRGSGPRQRFVEGPGWAVLRDAQEDAGGRILTRRITTFRKTGRRYRRSHEVHRLRLYRPSQVVAALRQAGFAVRRLPPYGEGWDVFLARKP
jgi:SAM-dependent methyltransferase